VQELLGHKTLTMTMKIYTKVRPQTKRQVVASLSYGAGSQAADHVLPLPTKGAKAVQNGDKLPATIEVSPEVQLG